MGGNPSARPNLKRHRPDWSWQDDAACRGEDLYLFFGLDGERDPQKSLRERKAKAICARCPVRGECLSYALSAPEKYGLYGGLNEDERASERRRRMRSGVPLTTTSTLPGFKECGRCREIKAVKEFSRNFKHPDGLSVRCRPCIQAIRKPTWARADTPEVA